MKTRTFPVGLALACAIIGHVSMHAKCDQIDTNIWSITAGDLREFGGVSKESSAPVGWQETYRSQLSSRGLQLFADRFATPAAELNLVRLSERGYSYHDAVVSMGRNGMRSVIQDALRETAVEELPVSDWEAYSGDLAGGLWSRVLANTFIGSLGNTREERVNLVSDSPSVAFIENRQSAVEQAGNEGLVRYGFRPWDQFSLYASVIFGHIVDGQPGTLDIRIRPLTDLDHFGTPNVEASLSIPLYDDTRFVAGASFYPTEIGSSGMRPSISARIEHAVGFKKLLWYIGFQTDASQASITGALTFPW
ncbi:MAG: hypothetical protein KGI49_02260 [Patescibacteria group bacterium]|nr:hypothetical protein [Patescibacteria group bacterium]